MFTQKDRVELEEMMSACARPIASAVVPRWQRKQLAQQASSASNVSTAGSAGAGAGAGAKSPRKTPSKKGSRTPSKTPKVRRPETRARDRRSWVDRRSRHFRGGSSRDGTPTASSESPLALTHAS